MKRLIEYIKRLFDYRAHAAANRDTAEQAQRLLQEAIAEVNALKVEINALKGANTVEYTVQTLPRFNINDERCMSNIAAVADNQYFFSLLFDIEQRQMNAFYKCQPTQLDYMRGRLAQISDLACEIKKWGEVYSAVTRVRPNDETEV